MLSPDPGPIPIIVRCHLCLTECAGSIVTIADRAWWAAMDHALDYHRAALIAAPDDVAEAFTVNRHGTPTRLRRPAAA